MVNGKEKSQNKVRVRKLGCYYKKGEKGECANGKYLYGHEDN